MNFVLKPAEGYALVYLDIIIYSHDLDDHRKHLKHVFQLLREAGLKIKPGKCEFVKQGIIYLGHIVSPKGRRRRFASGKRKNNQQNLVMFLNSIFYFAV